MHIGFIGLGIMGRPMAMNLLKAGHQLVVDTHRAAAVLEAMTALQAGGHGSDDHSGLLRHYETLASTRIGGSPS
jgi:3-hydroxyisobutyrate dehydrogenase-like beta-hydroxyacid dehydrogenase